jgi:NAD(P)-dependent dehydrogenase (short-subunit alcohol dehydrogenase family)
MDLKGKVALITGGNSGIGRAAAHAFAPEGAKVVIAARNAERGEQMVNKIQKSGGQVFFVATDVSKSNEVEALVQLRRIGDPKEAGELIAWLCSDAAS